MDPIEQEQANDPAKQVQEEENEPAPPANEGEQGQNEPAKPQEEEDPKKDVSEAWDPDRAMRTILRQREREKELQEALREAQAERDKYREATESEQERKEREAREARERATRAEAELERLLIENAIKDEALKAGVDPQKVARFTKLVSTEDVRVGDDQEVSGADLAVQEVLAEFPEFKLAEKPANEEKDEKSDPEPPGGNPDRKRTNAQPLTIDDVKRMAKEDPQRFNELMDRREIPASALGGGGK